jgi:solute carrier family 50 (sugar transporter)
VIIRNRSTEHYNPLTYVATLLNASLWVFYGVTKPDGLLVATVNGVGVLLEAIYVLLFLLFPPPAKRVINIYIYIFIISLINCC